MKFAIALDIPKGANDRRISVAVPELPGCLTFGHSIDEAKANAANDIFTWCESHAPNAPPRKLDWDGAEYRGWAWSEVEADVDRFFKEPI